MKIVDYLSTLSYYRDRPKILTNLIHHSSDGTFLVGKNHLKSSFLPINLHFFKVGGHIVCKDIQIADLAGTRIYGDPSNVVKIYKMSKFDGSIELDVRR
jgi:hypothetical protein